MRYICVDVLEYYTPDCTGRSTVEEHVSDIFVTDENGTKTPGLYAEQT